MGLVILIHLHARQSTLEQFFVGHIALENRILAPQPYAQGLNPALKAGWWCDHNALHLGNEVCAG